VIVSADAIVDCLRWMKGKVLLEEGLTEIVELMHRDCLIMFPVEVQFWAVDRDRGYGAKWRRRRCPCRIAGC